MRIFAVTLLALAGVTHAQDERPTDSLTRVPDLSPSLSADEVAKPFEEWKAVIAKVSFTWTPEIVAKLSATKKALAPKVPKPTKLFLYSLFPVEAKYLKSGYPERANELEKLPRFHDYPILGQVVLSDPAEANRWGSFLRDQIIPGGSFLCSFMPRHGFRFSNPKEGDVDFLMCYSCDQLVVFGAGKLDREHNPIFSRVTKDLLNRLFDKLKIERDVPKPPNG